MTDYLHSGANKMNKVEAYKNDNKLLLADKLGHAKVSSLKEQNLLNTIVTVQQHSNKITQLEADANKVRGAYVYKGTVETEFDLPLNNNSVGDVYNTSSTGMNYAWNGENWDELGRTSDEWTRLEAKFNHYEPKLRFDPVPVYSITLAEDMDVSSSTPLIITLPDGIQIFYLTYSLPTVTTNTIVVQIFVSGSQSRALLSALRMKDGIFGGLWMIQNAGLAQVISASGSSASSGKQAYIYYLNDPYIGKDNVSRIEIGSSSTTTIPAGSIITVYGAKEV